jgi:hypothetical protein
VIFYVRFPLKSGHCSRDDRCPLLTQSGRWRPTNSVEFAALSGPLQVGFRSADKRHQIPG